MKATRDEVRTYLLDLIRSMGDEWDDSQVISEDDGILGSMNWRSIEIVYLARAVQQHFDHVFPFQEFLEGVEQRDNKDLTVRELIDFVYANLQDTAQSVPSEVSATQEIAS
jgi:acyl carrier protein